MPAKTSLVNIQRFSPSIRVDLQYAKTENFLGTAVYPKDMPALLRAPAAEALAKAQSYFWAHHSVNLLVLDAWRPHDVQEAMWAVWPDDRFVARPERDGEGVIVRGSNHTRGVAVDLTLVDQDGVPLTMPTEFDAFVPEASPLVEGRSRAAHAHMQLLAQGLAAHGFQQHPHEWWHFEWVPPCGTPIPFADMPTVHG